MLAATEFNCQTPRGLGMCDSKTIQWDEREYAVTWLQQQNLIQ